MKALILLFILVIYSNLAVAQNEKCQAFSNKIVENVKGKILCHSEDEDLYCFKAEFPKEYELESIKTICDTTAKNVKVSYNWRINYDKNDEKEFLISGQKVLVTIYFDEKFLYFEFPKK